MVGVSDLIDTTEMYLRTIFELEEEGVVPLRARIAERLGQSGPTVSQTVARMERDGLLTVEGDRHLELSPLGRTLATRVMRKHRLAECLLVQVIGLDWEMVHEEACRWEHVMSEAVERRLLEVARKASRRWTGSHATARPRWSYGGWPSRCRPTPN
jgi:DtxR family Mn-dependent transcriptional regulator